MSDPPPDWHKPPEAPKRVLPYVTPPPPGKVRAFGSVGGNMAIGLAAFVASLVVGAMLGLRVRNAGPALTLGPGALVLCLGVLAAFFPRYRGVLTGMLLVILIALGIVLLVIGICSGIFK